MNDPFYSFTTEPFQLTPDHRMCFRHPSYQRIKTCIEYTVRSSDSFIMVTGESGSGKTTLINDLLDNPPTENLVTARLDSIHLEGEELLRMVAFSFGLDGEVGAKTTLLHNMIKFLTEQSKKGKKGLLIVDEGQALSSSALEELRLLSNIQDSHGPLLQVILVGQEKLLEVTLSPSMMPLRQRLIAACHLDPLASDQIEAYIKHRLRRVGWRGNPEFQEDLFPLIYKFSHGIPRRINLICKRLLLSGYTQDKQSLSTEDIQHSIEDLRKEKLALSEDEQVAEPFRLQTDEEPVAKPDRQPADHEQAAKPVRQSADHEQAAKPIRQSADHEQAAKPKPVRQPADHEQAAKPIRQSADHEQAAKPIRQSADHEQAAKPPKLNAPMESSELNQLRRHIYLKAKNINSSKSNRTAPLRTQIGECQKEDKGRMAALISLSVAAALILTLALSLSFLRTGKYTFASLNEGTQSEQMLASQQADEVQNQALEEPAVSDFKGDKAIQITQQAVTHKLELSGIDERQISNGPEPIRQNQFIQAVDQSIDQDKNIDSEIVLQQQSEESLNEHERLVVLSMMDQSRQKSFREEESNQPLPSNETNSDAEKRREQSMSIEQLVVNNFKKGQEVAKFLALAKRQRRYFKLTIPAGDNACETYKKVLELDPDNQEAKVGLNNLVEYYRSRAILFKKQVAYDLSSEFIRLGLKVKPKNTELLALQKQVEKSLNSQSKLK